MCLSPSLLAMPVGNGAWMEARLLSSRYSALKKLIPSAKYDDSCRNTPKIQPECMYGLSGSDLASM